MHRFSLRYGPLLLAGLALGLALGAVRADGQADSPIDIESLNTVESRKRAREELTSLADRERREHDLPALARALNGVVELQLRLNDPDAALPAARESLDVSRRSGNTPLLADTLTLCAVVYRLREDHKKALSLLEEALGLSRRLNYRRGEARSLAELGTTYFYKSEMEKAIGSDEEALKIWRELQDRREEANALYSLGAPYMRLGRLREAADTLEKAAAIWQELGRPTEQASALLDRNFLNIREGQWDKALTLLNQIQPLIPDKQAEPFISGQIATSFGEIYEAYGQLQTALSYYTEALTLYRDGAHAVAASIDLGSKVARVQARLGDYQRAIQQIGEGLRLAESKDNRFMVALCHEDLGKVHLWAGLYAQAKQEFEQAASGYEQTGNRREWARAQSFLAQSEYLLDESASASKSYQNALKVFQDIQDYTNEAAVCFGLGKLELEQQDMERAGKHLKRSIALTEQLRENAASKELRSSFLASVHDRYDTYVEWLMHLNSVQPGRGFDVEAFEASEMGRARSLLDSLRDYQRELRGAADPALLVEEEALQKKEQTLLDRQAKFQSEGGAAEEARKVEDELTQVRARQETLEAQINSDARFNDLLRSAPLTLDEIRRQVTDGETSLLEFSLGDRESYLWVVARDGMSSYKLPGRQIIEAAALRLARLFEAPPEGADGDSEIAAAAAEVSHLVLGPAAGKLRSYRLIVIPDGVLQYIPFQILADASEGGEPLVARHEIVNAPSASTLVLLRRETAGRTEAPKLLAAFGAPVVLANYIPPDPRRGEERAGATLGAGEDQQRTGTGSEVDTLDPNRIGSLFFAKQELNVLRKLAPADEALVYSGFDATRDRLRALDLRQYRVLHFATHGLLNARQPELSGLVLSLVDKDGRPVSGFVGLADIYHLRAPVDLVVLSACRSALGNDARGEGLIGLTRGFMYAGASGVVASLWKVDDEATAELMKRFYSNMLQRGMTPAAALREAQNSIRQAPQWRSPYYWAAFTLQGEYRQIIKPPRHRAVPGGTKAIVAALLLISLGGAAAWWLVRRRGKLPARAGSAIRR